MSAQDSNTTQPGNNSRPRRKRWVRRTAAVGFGLSLIVLAEVVCRLIGWGDPQWREDPFVGFAGTRPLFVLNSDGTEYVVPTVREEYFARTSFPAEKAVGTKRIFCLGGSTVQGRPWSIATSFTRWLELSLNTIDDEHRWEVVNCGGISYASYRLVPILEECLQYEPDRIIICTGHNEFLEDRSYPPATRSSLLHRASQLRLVNVARGWMDGVPKDSTHTSNGEEASDARTLLPLETEPILNFHNGLAVYHRDDAWQAGVADHYEVNLRRMVEMTNDAGLPLLLMRPASNLRDCPPFKSEPPTTFSPGDGETWSELISTARRLRETSPDESLLVLHRAQELDAESPLTHYELGRTYRKLRDDLAARREFVLARDLDVCPLRMTSELERRLDLVATETGTPLLDMHALMETACADGILGDDQLVDHVHPSIAGHQRIAAALVGQLAEQGEIALSESWEAEATTAWGKHLATLDSAYFLRGQRMLEGLRLWSQGRADGPPAAERFPGRDGIRGQETGRQGTGDRGQGTGDNASALTTDKHFPKNFPIGEYPPLLEPLPTEAVRECDATNLETP